MTYDRSIIPVLEAALDRNPFCSTCGTRTRIRQDGTRLLLECGADAASQGLVGRFLAWVVPHHWELVVS